MPREMKLILVQTEEHGWIMQDIRKGKYQQLASISSVKWGYADLYRFSTKNEYLIVTYRIGQETRFPHAEIYIGGKQETGTTWRRLCKWIAGGVP